MAKQNGTATAAGGGGDKFVPQKAPVVGLFWATTKWAFFVRQGFKRKR